jgi:hypothetical protein
VDRLRRWLVVARGLCLCRVLGAGGDGLNVAVVACTGRAAAAAGQSGLMALYDNLFGLMDLQAAQVLLTANSQYRILSCLLPDFRISRRHCHLERVLLKADQASLNQTCREILLEKALVNGPNAEPTGLVVSGRVNLFPFLSFIFSISCCE